MPLPLHPYLEPSRVRHDLGAAAAGDPFGDRVHIRLGALWCLCLGFPTSVVEIASIPLLVFFVLRTPKIWRTWGSFAVQPLTLALGGWVVWQAVTLSWTPDLNMGLQELAANRWIWVMWVLWPIIGRRPILIAAVCVGFLIGNLSQVGHAVGKAAGIGWLTWPRLENRNSGWWDPVVGGSLLVGVLGLHLPAAVMGAGRQRLWGIAGSVATLAGIFATGTRGAWIAGAGLLCMVLATALVRAARKRGGGRGVAVGAVALVGAVVLAGLALRGTLSERYEQGRREVEAALERGDYSSDTGRRILMWRAAAEAIASNPLGGTGAGGYRAWAMEHVRIDGEPPPAGAIHVHAHSTALHIAATTGLVGLLLSGLVLAAAAYGALAELRAGEIGGYAAGSGFAIVGLMLAGVFDPVHLNAQTGALLATMMALSLLSRPTIMGTPTGGEGRLDPHPAGPVRNPAEPHS